MVLTRLLMFASQDTYIARHSALSSQGHLRKTFARDFIATKFASTVFFLD